MAEGREYRWGGPDTAVVPEGAKCPDLAAAAVQARRCPHKADSRDPARLAEAARPVQWGGPDTAADPAAARCREEDHRVQWDGQDTAADPRGARW